MVCQLVNAGGILVVSTMIYVSETAYCVCFDVIGCMSLLHAFITPCEIGSTQTYMSARAENFRSRRFHD